MFNHQITKILREIGVFLEMDDIPFKPIAYEKAAHSVEILDEELEDIYKEGGLKALDEIPGVGESISKKIETLLLKGKLPYYEKLKKKYPIAVLDILSVGGVGPATLKILYDELKIKNLHDLQREAEEGNIGKIKGLGEKTEQNILKGIKFLKKTSGRFLLGFVYPKIQSIVSELRKVEGVKKIEIAGSARRMRETIGDLDLLAVSDKPEKLMEKFTTMRDVDMVLAKGKTKVVVILASGLQVDLRVVPEKSWGSALSYFTGSKAHSVALRQRALKMGMTLNEYGLYKKKNGKGKFIAGKNEKELYKALKLQYIPPEMRENSGEIELAEKNKIPKLIDYGDLSGDLQVQTDWSDGDASIEEMAKSAMKIGLKYMVVTDHTKSLKIAGGSDEKRLLKQMKEIDKLNKKFKGKFTVLKGAEVNILKDGKLDIDDKVLKKLDVVGAAVHNYFNLSEKEMTDRICKAMENENIDIIFHLTGRRINYRPEFALDMDKILETAKKTKTVLEIDAYPDRLDIKDNYIKKMVGSGIKMCIDTDAHSSAHFKFLKFGIGQARRGGAKKNDIINTYSAKKMLSLLKK